VVEMGRLPAPLTEIWEWQAHGACREMDSSNFSSRTGAWSVPGHPGAESQAGVPTLPGAGGVSSRPSLNPNGGSRSRREPVISGGRRAFRTTGMITDVSLRPPHLVIDRLLSWLTLLDHAVVQRQLLVLRHEVPRPAPRAHAERDDGVAGDRG
jgi:hypothetical protein